MTLRQQQTEQSETVSVDTACAPSAEMLGLLLEGLSSSEEEKRILNRLGYMLGRFVYLCDAVDDLEKDKKHGAFNPLNSQNVHPDEAEGMLRLTIAEACRAYDLLSPQCYRGVLDNIMFLGLQNTADSLLTRRRQDEKSI